MSVKFTVSHQVTKNFFTLLESECYGIFSMHEVESVRFTISVKTLMSMRAGKITNPASFISNEWLEQSYIPGLYNHIIPVQVDSQFYSDGILCRASLQFRFRWNLSSENFCQKATGVGLTNVPSVSLRAEEARTIKTVHMHAAMCLAFGAWFYMWFYLESLQTK